MANYVRWLNTRKNKAMLDCSPHFMGVVLYWLLSTNCQEPRVTGDPFTSITAMFCIEDGRRRRRRPALKIHRVERRLAHTHTQTCNWTSLKNRARQVVISILPKNQYRTGLKTLEATVRKASDCLIYKADAEKLFHLRPQTSQFLKQFFFPSALG